MPSTFRSALGAAGAAGDPPDLGPNQLYTWGSQGDYGYTLGHEPGTTGNFSSPVAVGSAGDYDSPDGELNATVDLSDDFAGQFVDSSNRTFSVGRNETEKLGLSAARNALFSNKTQVGSLTNWAAIRGGNKHSFWVKTDGTAWTAGDGPNSGQGAIADQGSPIQLGSLTNWSPLQKHLAGAFESTLAIKTDGTLWAWGRNSFGGLGLGDTASRNSPVQVGTDTDWDTVTVSFYNSAAIKTDGTLWTTGYNGTGQLGQGDTTDRSSFTQVGSATNWTKVVAASDTDGHMVALNSLGEVYVWGNNSQGQLGLGDTTARSTPTQLSGTFVNVGATDRASFFIREELAGASYGSLWSVGLNNRGQLGLGDVTNRSSPVQVGTETDWTRIAEKANVGMIFGMRGT